jgi:hypothetical protein
MRNNCMIGNLQIMAGALAEMLQFGAASAQETVELAPVEEKKARPANAFRDLHVSSRHMPW